MQLFSDSRFWVSAALMSLAWLLIVHVMLSRTSVRSFASAILIGQVFMVVDVLGSQSDSYRFLLLSGLFWFSIALSVLGILLSMLVLLQFHKMGATERSVWRPMIKLTAGCVLMSLAIVTGRPWGEVTPESGRSLREVGVLSCVTMCPYFARPLRVSEFDSLRFPVRTADEWSQV